MGQYSVAQICMNGHEITSMYDETPELRAKFCEKCGESTTTECAKCSSKIRGYYNVPGVFSLETYKVPNYCHGCGEPYPWTQKLLSNAIDLVELDEGLNKEEKEIIKNAFPDLIFESSNTPVAIARYKKYMEKAQSYIKNGVRQIFIDVVSESVKKSIWG